MLRLGFEEFNLNRIELDVLASNHRAIRAYEKAGFVAEGRSREAIFRGGRFVDLLRYAILRWEWAQGRRDNSHAEPVDAVSEVVVAV